MYNGNKSLMNYDKWNRRMMNLLWICNVVIFIVQAVICFFYYNNLLLQHDPASDFLPLAVYIKRFIFTPMLLIILLTVGCEIALSLLKRNYKNIQPYAIIFTVVGYCAVLLAIYHYFTVIFVIYVVPIFFSLLYNNKRILLCTFLISILVFIGVYIGYFRHVSKPYISVTLADVVTTIAILFVAYLIGRVILNRFEEIISTMMDAEHYAYESRMAQKHAEAVAEARTRFLANVSHEIRTPMTAVIGFTELALDDTTLSENQQDHLRKIKISADALLGIINNILDISKIYAGEFFLETIPFDLHRVLSECKIMVSRMAEEKELRFYFYEEVEIDKKLIGDPVKLRQVLLNLLSNAITFTNKGSVTFIAKNDESAKDSDKLTIFFEVSDTGIGMTEEQCKKVFEPFKQVDDSATRKYGGAGLGLSITKSIVEKMGGKIDVKSIPNIGSRFSFSLEFELSDEKSKTETIDIKGSERPVFSGEVLLCEDNKMNQQVAIENLKKLGFHVILAENGKICIDMVKKRQTENKPFDVILMDIHMPVADGLSTAEKLKEMNIKMPIIAMTANTTKEDKEKYAKAGMIDCIYKPFTMRELWICLLKHLKPVGKTTDAVPPSDKNYHENKTPVDTMLGIKNSANNEKLYHDFLHAFLEEQPDTLILLEEAIMKCDFPLAGSIAHKARGSAKIIGAEKLSELLTILEEALRRDGSYFKKRMLEDYKKELDIVLKYIPMLVK